MSIVIWEWKDDSCWCAYKPKVSNFIEDFYQQSQSGSGFLQLGGADLEMSPYEINICTLQQRRVSTGMLRDIRRTVVAKNGTHNDFVWEWKEGSRWTPYDPHSNKIIEKNFREKVTQRFSLSNRYSVELSPQPIQINNHTGFRRPIKRHGVKYVEVSENHKGDALVNGATGQSTSSAGSSKYFLPNSNSTDATARSSKSPETPKVAKTENSNTPTSSSSTDEQALFQSKMPKHIKFDYCLKPYKKPEVEANETEETCPICLLEFDELFSDYVSKGGETAMSLSDEMSVTLPCGHPVHLGCALQIYRNEQEKYLICPLCKKVFAGTRIGTQPVGGSMTVRLIDECCPGFEGHKTHQITYNIPSGTQGPEHPNPGSPYYTSGFPRVAYIPATEEGNLIVKMLRVAFERRLIFTVGTSHTTGMSDMVVWSSVHHKTSICGTSHSYPDPNHLHELKQELYNVNVFESDVQ